MRSFSYDCTRRRVIPLFALSWSLFALLISGAQVQAAAPTRVKPYAESICNTNPNVFFCEDFEGEDIINHGSGNCSSTWGNPAIQNEDICWAGGGSHQLSTTALPVFDQNTNRVWRITKSQSFTDINTSINTGTGNGTLAAWLKPAILGTGAQEWYARAQVWFSSDHTWPADYDFKMFFAIPRSFIDPPSAAYETGMSFHQDVWCSGQYFPPSGRSFNDVPVIRNNNQYKIFPYQNEYCPPLAPGLDADGTHAPRIQKGRWYTLEYHVKLSSSTNGILELWVDGNKAYSSNRATCSGGCPDMGYIMIMGWMNGADQRSGYYEIDNVIMSRSYIGPPNGGTPPPPNDLPLGPTNLSITLP